MSREPKTAMLLRLPTAQAARVRRLAGRLGVNQAALLRQAVEELLAKHPEPEVVPEPAPEPEMSSAEAFKLLCDTLDECGAIVTFDPNRRPGNGAVGRS